MTKSESMSKHLVTVAGLSTTVLVSAVTAINGCHQTEMAKAQQTHMIRMAYFDKAINPELGRSFHQKVLRFLSNATSDPALKSWADDELTRYGSEAIIIETICSKDHERFQILEDIRRFRKAGEESTVVTLQCEVDSLEKDLKAAKSELGRLNQLAAKDFSWGKSCIDFGFYHVANASSFLSDDLSNRVATSEDIP